VRFLLDQDVYALTARFLRALEHDVVTAAEIGCSQATDVALLRIAQDQERLFVTRDRDFGALVFVEDAGGSSALNRLSLPKFSYLAPVAKIVR